MQERKRFRQDFCASRVSTVENRRYGRFLHAFVRMFQSDHDVVEQLRMLEVSEQLSRFKYDIPARIVQTLAGKSQRRCADTADQSQ